jgi:hypothetical protein
MRSADAAKVLQLDHLSIVARLRDRAGLPRPIGAGGVSTRWSPGDVLAMFVVLECDGASDGRESRWAEGARKCGEALDAGYPPAYLVTRGGSENVVVIESESPAQTDEMVAALLLQASDAGAAVKVVRLRPIVKRLAPWMAELVDA